MGTNGHFSAKKIITTHKNHSRELRNKTATQLQPLRFAQGHPDSSQRGRVLLIHNHINIFKPVREFKTGISRSKHFTAAFKLLCTPQKSHNRSYMQYIIYNP